MHTTEGSNLLVTPFSFDTEQNAALQHPIFEKARAFYMDVWEEDAAELDYIIGNGAGTIEYEANGEASDWMLGTEGIYAMSIELDTREEYFITDADDLKDVVISNYVWMESILLRYFPKLSLTFVE